MWMLYEKCKDGDNIVYIDVGCKPSGDACKALAKKISRREFNGRTEAEFLIRDPAGNDWMKSVNTGSWRMKWVNA